MFAYEEVNGFPTIAAKTWSEDAFGKKSLSESDLPDSELKFTLHHLSHLNL